jgi:threonine synthase
VQSENCSPLLQAAAKKSPHPADVIPSETLAEGIAIGKPMRGKEILKYVYQYGVQVIPVPEKEILPAQRELAEKGIFCEHTTAATYAAYQEYIQRYGILKDVLLPICGAGIKSQK